jgi:hypothetical protein
LGTMFRSITFAVVLATLVFASLGRSSLRQLFLPLDDPSPCSLVFTYIHVPCLSLSQRFETMEINMTRSREQLTIPLTTDALSPPSNQRNGLNRSHTPWK